MKKTMLRRITAAALAGFMLTGTVYGAGFSDTTGDSNREAIKYVTEQKLFSGASADRFEPSAALTRGMAAMVLAKQAEAQGTAAAASKALGGRFSDVAADAYYAAAADFVTAEGIMKGTSGGRFEPDKVMSRTELKQVVEQYLVWLGRDGAPEMIGEGTEPVTRGEAASVFAGLDRFLAGQKTELLAHRAQDGVELTGKLSLPDSDRVSKIVLFVNGSGPNTYDNRREYRGKAYNYYDLFAEQLTARGIGFFRWSARGVYPDDEALDFMRIDDEIYRTYVPETSIGDVHEWIETLCARPELADADVYLLGFSEGSIVAANAAKRWPEEIDGLFLAGYCNDTVPEILDQQLSKIEPAELRSVIEKTVYAAIENDDGAWIEENYGTKLTRAWFRGHGKLRPNRELLPELSLPIEIFHGTADRTCSVDGVYDIRRIFEEKGKTNLKIHVYGGYGHEMKYSSYLKTGVMPQAFVDLFQRLCETEEGSV